MKQLKIILVAALAFSLAGCVLSGKPKPTVTPAVPAQPLPPPTPPEPLSVPQTHPDQLPANLPVDPSALVTAPPVESRPAVSLPQGPPPPPARPVTAQPRPVDTPTAPAVETARPPIREILSPEEQTRLKASAEGHKSEVRKLVAQAQGRGLNGSQRNTLVEINQFMKQSQQAEEGGEFRAADEFAAKAHILAKELQGGK